MQLGFGSGTLWGERTDVSIAPTIGNGARPFGVLQDISLDFSFTDKPLHGQYQWPVALARGQGTITGKAKFAQIYGPIYSELFWGLPLLGTQLTVAQDEAHVIGTGPIGTTPLSVANFSTYFDDLGVRYQAGATVGAPSGILTRVGVPVGPGQYGVDFVNGAYYFYTATPDAGLTVLISYTWNSNGVGTKLTMTNQLMGTTPIFKMTFRTTTPGASNKSLVVRLNKCVSSKLMFPTKLDDWSINELDFSAYADDAGVVGYMSTAE